MSFDGDTSEAMACGDSDCSFPLILAGKARTLLVLIGARRSVDGAVEALSDMSLLKLILLLDEADLLILALPKVESVLP